MVIIKLKEKIEMDYKPQTWKLSAKVKRRYEKV